MFVLNRHEIPVAVKLFYENDSGQLTDASLFVSVNDILYTVLILFLLLLLLVG